MTYGGGYEGGLWRHCSYMPGSHFVSTVVKKDQKIWANGAHTPPGYAPGNMYLYTTKFSFHVSSVHLVITIY